MTDMKNPAEPQGETPTPKPIVKSLPKGIPNERQTPSPAQPEVDYFRIEPEGINVIVEAINAVVINKFVKQTLFNAINSELKMIPKKDKK